MIPLVRSAGASWRLMRPTMPVEGPDRVPSGGWRTARDARPRTSPLAPEHGRRAAELRRSTVVQPKEFTTQPPHCRVTLLESGRFTLCPGMVEAVEERDHKYTVSVRSQGSARTVVVDRVILRHGPHAIGENQIGAPRRKLLEADFPNIWKATTSLRNIWESAPQHDWTRTPLFEPADFVPGTDYRGQLRVNFQGRMGCVVVASTAQHVDLHQRVKGGLKYFAQRYKSFTSEARRAVDRIRRVPVQEAFGQRTLSSGQCAPCATPISPSSTSPGRKPP